MQLINTLSHKPQRAIYILFFLLFGALLSSHAFKPDECFDCHSDPEIADEVDPPNKGLYIPEKKFYNSVHGKEDCNVCHRDADPDHDGKLKPAACDSCHKAATRKYRSGLHYKAFKEKDPYAPTCATCHGIHDMRSSKNPYSPTYSMNIPLLCGKCHKEGSEMIKFHHISKTSMVEHYSMSIHGKGLFESGLKVTATCVSCHMSHEILPHTDRRSSIHRKNISKTCMDCHTSIEKVHKKVIKGKFWKQAHKTPVCIECHAPHKIKTDEKGKKGVASFDDAYCMSCHSDSSLTVTDNNNNTRSLWINKDHFEGSAHQDLQCVKCHVDVDFSRTPVCKQPQKVDCASCHQDETDRFSLSVHGNLSSKEDPDAPDCISCHGTHNIKLKEDITSPIFRANIPTLCSKCHRNGKKAAIRLEDHSHPDMVEKYEMSIHGKALDKSGLLVTAVCTDCHSSHEELPSSDTLSLTHSRNIATTCSKCHFGIKQKFKQSIHSPEYNTSTKKELPACNSCHSSHTIKRVDKSAFRQGMIEQCGNCHQRLTDSYFETYHGKVHEFGPSKTAECHDCHGSHSILPQSDSLSTLSKVNIVETCKKCHPDANENFTKYLTHANHRDKERNPSLYWAWFLMTTLLLSTLFAFMVHTVLWFIREFLHHAKHRTSRQTMRPPKKKRYFQRYPLYHRITHILVIISFLGLTATGLPLKYAHSGWAKTIMDFIGGYQVAGFIHRFCAVLTGVYVILHLGWLVYMLIKAKRLPSLKSIFGPDSMMLRWKDIQDIIAHVRWFLFLGPRPRFDRWTYWDKADYWGEFWGVTVIGSTGLLLWFSGFFSLFLPGWVFNLATVIHSIEALLATCIIFLVHFFNVHLRPSKFPMDPVIFSGNMSEEEFKEEHPLEYERLVQAGELDKHSVPKTNRFFSIFIRIFGISAFSFGLLLVALIMIAEWNNFFG
ncbi:MAG: hypothetical protein HQK83_10715 [Fibrobacteria bacterium]|nr:hypothetical protein [Fibrobacteria bacterium]